MGRKPLQYSLALIDHRFVPQSDTTITGQSTKLQTSSINHISGSLSRKINAFFDIEQN